MIPIDICNVREAITLQVLKKAEAIRVDENQRIRSQYLSLPLPRVIMLFNFHKIPRKKVIHSRLNIIYRDDEIVAFPDINPVAPTHILIVPVRHIGSLAELSDGDENLAGRMMTVACKLAREAGVAERGFRIVINSGKEGGQVVPHLHLHLLAGRPLNVKMA